MCFLNSLPNGFTYDDNPIVREHPRIRSLADQRSIWLRDWWYVQADDVTTPDPSRDRLYRPLTLFTFAVNYAAGGLNPLGYHAVNVALHALCCALVWHFAVALLRRPDIATVGALLFAVHPLHCEAVANIVGRAEVLAALFLLTGLLCLLRSSTPPGWLSTTLAAFAFLGAMLAKETAVSYPLLAAIALHHRYGDRQRTVGWWAGRLGIVCLPLFIYFPLRIAALEGLLMRSDEPAANLNPLLMADAGGRVYGAFVVLGHYARLMLIPSKLSADYGLGVISPTVSLDPWSVGMAVLGAATFIALMLALWGYRRPRDSTWRRLAVLTALILASYVLISNTVLLIGVSLAERLVYWLSAPALLLIAALVVEGWQRWCSADGPLARRATLLRAAGLLLLAALGLRTVTRNPAWKDDRTLFGTDVSSWPDNVHLGISYARNLIYAANAEPDPQRRLALLEEAFPIIDRAIHVHRYSLALRTMGELLALRSGLLNETGDVQAALNYLYLARQLNPRDAATQDMIAQLEGRNVDEQTANLRARVAAEPDDLALRLELATTLLGYGRQRPAREHVEHALRIDPQNVDALRLMGQVEMLDHADEKALALFRQVIERAPDDWGTHVNLSYLLRKRDPVECLRQAEAAFKLQPNAFETHTALAEALIVAGQTSSGLSRLEQLWRTLPSDDPRRMAVMERIEHVRRLGR